MLSRDRENFIWIKVRPDKDPGAWHFLGDTNGGGAGFVGSNLIAYLLKKTNFNIISISIG